MAHGLTDRHHPRLGEILAQVHALGASAVAPHPAHVDARARFPAEAFAALRDAKLLSCYVPEAHGGMGLSILDLSKICEALGTYCASTAMIFAMHQIQVGCIVHHALGSPYFQRFAREIVERQLLLASATTELGIGGDVRTSTCAVVTEGERFSLVKQAPVISYALDADGILVTARRAPEAGPSDQVHCLVRKGDCTLEPLSSWDTLGFRGTCSLGFTLRAHAAFEQVLPVPYAEIHAKTMHPFSHSVWSSLWLGLASDAVAQARAIVRAQARKTPGTLPPAATRLAEVDGVCFRMRSLVEHTISEYHQRLAEHPGPFPSDFGFALRVNNLKVSASELVVDIVGKSLLICGMAGYRNDSKHTLGRHLRDAYGAALMVNNDRILGQSSTMLLGMRDS